MSGCSLETFRRHCVGVGGDGTMPEELSRKMSNLGSLGSEPGLSSDPGEEEPDEATATVLGKPLERLMAARPGCCTQLT